MQLGGIIKHIQLELKVLAVALAGINSALKPYHPLRTFGMARFITVLPK